MKVHYAVGKYIIAIFILLLLVITTLLFFTSHIQDFDYENKDQEELSFLSQGNRLSGTLLTPQHKTPSAVIVVIHGDGPQNCYFYQFSSLKSFGVMPNSFLKIE